MERKEAERKTKHHFIDEAGKMFNRWLTKYRNFSRLSSTKHQWADILELIAIWLYYKNRREREPIDKHFDEYEE